MGGLTFGAIEAGEEASPHRRAHRVRPRRAASVAFLVRQRHTAHPMVPSTCSAGAPSRHRRGRLRVRRRLLGAAVRDEPLPATTAGPVGVPDRPRVPADDADRAALTPSSARIAERFGAPATHRHRHCHHGDRTHVLAVLHTSTRRTLCRTHDPRRTVRPPRHATGHRSAAQQRPRPPCRHRQRRVQHQPTTRRSARHRRLRSPAHPTRRVHPGLRLSLLIAAVVALAAAATGLLLRTPQQH